jgi:predicted regulator of Ras-like GTPase activity (Roadblock/LC7/MglB family)
MPTIRELVQAIARREGVDAVVVVGRDGLPIDSASADGTGIDAETVAAQLPAAVRGMTELGSAGGRGEFATGVLEFGGGLAVVAVLHSEALLVILVRPDTNIGTLLFDLRRHRTAIAGLL